MARRSPSFMYTRVKEIASVHQDCIARAAREVCGGESVPRTEATRKEILSLAAIDTSAEDEQLLADQAKLLCRNQKQAKLPAKATL